MNRLGIKTHFVLTEQQIRDSAAVEHQFEVNALNADNKKAEILKVANEAKAKFKTNMIYLGVVVVFVLIFVLFKK